MYKLKLGVSVGTIYENTVNVNFEHQILKLKKLGFDSIDLNLFGCRRLSVYDECLNKLPEFFKIVRDNGLIVNGVHMPFGGVMDISTPDKQQLKESLDLAVKIFSVVDKLKPNCYIFHGSGEPIPQNLREEMKDILADSLNFLTSKTDIPVCIENLPRTCLLNTSNELNEFLKVVPKTFVCVDTNHFLTEKTENAIINIGSIIKTLHVSDFDYVDERHWLPGQGSIDWQKVISALEKIGYDGVFNYELCPNYDFEQIKENYDKLFELYNK